jgi:hypothetical protein
MATIRRLVATHPAILVLAFAAALLLRALVPSGYMPENKTGRITLAICSGSSTVQQVIELPVHGQDKDSNLPHAHSDMAPCHFAGHSLPLLADDVQPILSGIAPAVRTLPALRRATRLLGERARYRPPSRGPPPRSALSA